MNLTVISENVVKCSYFRCSTRSTALMLLRHLVDVVANGVAMFVLLITLLLVECLHWKFHCVRVSLGV